VSAHDVKLDALNEINRARAYIVSACARLRAMQKKSKRAGILIETLDYALDDASTADEYVCAARLVLWSAFADEQKTKCV